MNENTCEHTHAGLQACPHSCLPSILPSGLLADWPACVPAGKQAYRQNLPTDRSANRQT